MTRPACDAVPGCVIACVVYSPDPALLGREVVLDPSRERVTFGRGAGADVVLESSDLSRHHATFTWVDGRWTVRDDGSTNGVFVNGVRVERAVLATGDLVTLGQTALRFDRPPGIVETVYTPTTIDGLTGVSNLRHLLEMLGAAEPAAAGCEAVLVLVDVDELRRVNERHGHLLGDQLLVELARRLRAAAGADARVARVAGDTFAVLWGGATMGEAEALGAALRARVLGRAFILGERYVRVGLSLGVAAGPALDAGLLDRARTDLARRRGPSAGSGASCEWALGVWSPETSRALDVAAGAAFGGEAGRVVVSEGGGAHATGWFGARLVVRVLLERFAPLREACLLGPADIIPDAWGWAGAERSQHDGERLYADGLAELGDVTALPHDLPALLEALDRVLASPSMKAARMNPMTECIAATVVDGAVVGAHVGTGRARLLRAGADVFEDLVVPHHLHRVAHRSRDHQGLDLALLNGALVSCNGLGALMPGVGIDSFHAELLPGDVLVLASTELGVPDDALASVLHAPKALAAQVRTLEARLDQRRAASERAPAATGPRECAFALLRGR